MAKENELETEAFDWLNEYAGQGQEELANAGARSSAFLSMVQPDTDAATSAEPGTWRNSATGKNFGNMIRVIPLAFHVIWSERESEAPFRTVGRYAPHSIPVETRQPKPGKRGFAKMYNPDTGNEVQELYVYAVLLPDFPEEGLLYFNPSVINMKTCRGWNSQIFGQLLPNGVQAPIFAYQWQLVAELVPNPQQPSKKIAKFTKVLKDSLVSRDLFGQAVKPLLDTVKPEALLITDMTTDGSDVEE